MAPAHEHDHDEEWRGFLTGELPGLNRTRRILRRIPSSPRCKLCSAPFGRPGSILLRPLSGGRSPLNRRLCNWCIRSLGKHPGGAELEITVLFADVRGSTGLAEGMPAAEFSALLARFYGTAARVVDRWDGILDKFVGDAAVALFIPGIAGTEHAAAALDAARDLVGETGAGTDDPWIPVGIGVHTGLSYVGAVGEGDVHDFTAVGDTVNAASRLSGLAVAGEVLVGAAAAEAAGLDTISLERRTLELRGREETLEAVVLPAAVPAGS